MARGHQAENHSPAAEFNVRGGQDFSHAARIFSAKGRVLVENFLEPGMAEQAAAAMRAFPYHLTLSRPDGGAAKIDPAQIAARGPEFTQGLMQALYAQGRTGFAYHYRQFDFDRPLPPEDQHHAAPAKAFWNLLSGAGFLETVGRIIGAKGLRLLSAQATAYEPFHFLTMHDDAIERSGRVAAFVLYFNKGWQADWGGLLQFIDDDGHVAEGFLPLFNALALLKVPSRHTVSMVTPLAAEPRYAISGWVG